MKRFPEQILHHKRRIDVPPRRVPFPPKSPMTRGLGFRHNKGPVVQRIKVIRRVGVGGVHTLQFQNMR